MGFLDAWKVSGITAEASKSSEPFYLLAKALNRHNVGDFEIPESHLRSCASLFLESSIHFELYFLTNYIRGSGVDENKTIAIKFLVALSAFLLARDGKAWNWQVVREFSQGLYTSMEESREEFRTHNLPLIESIVNDVKQFIQH